MAAELTTGAAGALSLSALAVPLLVLSDYRGFRPGRYLFKPLAALAFLWLALAMGATGSAYGWWVLAGLICCALGDLLLMPDDERCFLAGLVSFLCGHLCYAVAFLSLDHSLHGMMLNSVPAIALLLLAWRWLRPHLDSKMKTPVFAYTVVITAMLLCAGSAAQQPAAPLIMAGAWGFAVSDLAVARQQFVYPSRRNGLWGSPLYFVSQMLLAASVASI
jgi:uncharacterized membrane protein YhhN